MSNKVQSSEESIEPLIRAIRGQRVILDSDLARIYGVQTGRLTEQVKRNAKRFPSDFLFQLTAQEVESLRSQSATLKRQGNLSQIAIGSQKHRDPRLLPYAFTENGAIMAANVLNSPEAVRMSVFVVRAFVKMRELLGGTKELARQLAELERKLIARPTGTNPPSWKFFSASCKFSIRHRRRPNHRDDGLVFMSSRKTSWEIKRRKT